MLQRISKISLENNCVEAFRLAILLKEDSNAGVSSEICEIFKNTHFEEHLPTPCITVHDACFFYFNPKALSFPFIIFVDYKFATFSFFIQKRDALIS